MKLTDVFNSKAIANNWTEVASNSIAYLGTGFFPAKKKAGLDLKWIKGHKGLPVSLAPSAFDAKSKFRDRIGMQISETQMAFFRESMLIKEADEQEIMRVEDSNDPYARQVLENIFDDARSLVDGANVVPERMIMQLLAPLGGNIGIAIDSNGTNYTYNYDPDGSWKKDHYIALKGTSAWTDSANCDPLKDIEDALDSQEAVSGTRPKIALMSKKTFADIKASAKVQKGILAQNPSANVNYTSKKVKAFVEEELDITIIVYSKKYRNEAGTEANFYPDNGVMLLPDGAIGSTYYGTTPEERTLASKQGADVSIVNTGVAVAVTITDDPVNTKTTVSEIVLPSFERMNDCYFIETAEA